jgi:hypothetical protein
MIRLSPHLHLFDVSKPELAENASGRHLSQDVFSPPTGHILMLNDRAPDPSMTEREFP